MSHLTAKWQNTEFPPIYPLAKSKLSSNSIPQIKKLDLSQICNNKPCFLLYNVLSLEECKALIAASEATGFEDADSYCHMYRDRYNDRLQSDDEEFSKMVMERVKEFLPKEYCPSPTKYSQGKLVWTLKELNPRWRYCRYFAGHYFGCHTDGSWSPGPGTTSFLTFMLYLNGADEFEGGTTNFVDHRAKKVKYKVIPEPGMAVVFVQEDLDLLHEGSKLTSGTKYILRSDVMYDAPKKV